MPKSAKKHLKREREYNEAFIVDEAGIRQMHQLASLAGDADFEAEFSDGTIVGELSLSEVLDLPNGASAAITKLTATGFAPLPVLEDETQKVDGMLSKARTAFESVKGSADQGRLFLLEQEVRRLKMERKRVEDSHEYKVSRMRREAPRTKVALDTTRSWRSAIRFEMELEEPLAAQFTSGCEEWRAEVKAPYSRIVTLEPSLWIAMGNVVAILSLVAVHASGWLGGVYKNTETAERAAPWLLAPGLVVFWVTIVAGFGFMWLSRSYPLGVFLLGFGAQRNQRKSARRKRIGGVVLAIAVSVVGGLIVFGLTR